MDTAVLGDRQPEVTQRPVPRPIAVPELRESSKVLAGRALHEILSQYPLSAFQGFSRGFLGVAGGGGKGQQQFATQTPCVHLLGIEINSEKST